MDYRRTSQRRRRVALDQNQNAANPSAEKSNQASSSGRSVSRQPYGRNAKRSRQPKTTDLIPKRNWPVAAVLALLLASFVGLNLMHSAAPRWIEIIGQQGVQALSIDNSRGIAAWYSNFLLLLTSCVSLQLYLLRQHRRDDYRGTYRIWLWLCGLFLLASMACVTGIFELLQNSARFLMRMEAGQGILLIMIAKLIGVSLLVVRGIFEVRHSVAATAALGVVFCAYNAAIVVEIPQVQSQIDNYFQAAQNNLMLIGSTALLTCLLLYARFVYLEANGLIAISSKAVSTGRSTQSQSKKKLKAKPEQSKNDSAVEPSVSRSKKESSKKELPKKESSESSQPKSQSLQRQARAKPKPKSKPKSKSESRQETDQQNSGGDYADQLSELSKSERRRQRKIKRRQQNRAA